MTKNEEAVLQAVWSGSSRQRDIVRVSGVPKGSVNRALTVLESMGLVRRVEDCAGGGTYRPAHSCLDCLHREEVDDCQVVDKTAYDVCDRWAEAKTEEDDEDEHPVLVADAEQVGQSLYKANQVMSRSAPVETQEEVDELDAYDRQVRELAEWMGSKSPTLSVWQGLTETIAIVRDAIEGMREARKEYAEADRTVRVGLAMLEAGRKAHGGE